MFHWKRSAGKWLAPLAAILLAGLMLAGLAAAAPGTQVYIGDDPGSADLELNGLTLFDSSGGTIIQGGTAGTINFLLNGTPYVGYCTDTTRFLSGDPEPVEVTVQEPPSTAAGRAAAWIILNRTPAGPQTDESRFAAATAQVAVWLLVDPNINATAPSDNQALNDAALALAQEALTATATPSGLALSAAGPAAGSTTTQVTVTGRPGAVVQLATSAGSLSSTQVTIGPSGTTSVTLTVPGPGAVSVSASTAGDGRLFLIEPTDPERRPQPTATAEPTTLTASASILFQAAPVPATPTPGASGTPVPVTQTPRAARLAITKRAPSRARVLQRVRYTIRVTNRGSATARRVVLRDRLPNGMSFIRSSRRGVVRKGSIVVQLGNLAPGRSRSVAVYLRANAGVRGARVNRATASASGTRAVTARARTVFLQLPRRIQPAVTG